MNKKIVFISGTRADYGKIKSIIKILIKNKFKIKIFVTGMHLVKKFGETHHEIAENFSKKRIYKFKNYKPNDSLDLILSNTVRGFSKFIKREKPDLVIVHGDRVETLAAAISASFNNILVGHIEGGEISGSIDEHIRHSVSKLSHIHFVSTERASVRLKKMGEIPKNVFVVGSPDLDIMSSKSLPDIKEVKKRYEINFKNYGIVIYHPVTTSLNNLHKNSKKVIDSLKFTNKNYIIVYPNNDPGNDIILNNYKNLLFKNKRFKFIRSMRFEYFLTLLKNSSIIIGNSSSGVIEAPFYGIPTINIGSRQNLRSDGKSIINCKHNSKKLEKLINHFFTKKFKKNNDYGKGNSDKKITYILKNKKIWKTPLQKQLSEY